MKPFLKWAGSKYKIVERIRNSLPPGKRLIEPFAGSGAVFLNTTYEEYLVADSNADLINLFEQIKSNGENFIEYAKPIFNEENNTESTFYRFREEFNDTKDFQRKAALFIYLNRHCFNGLCRYNSKGGFNVPFGRYAGPKFPEEEVRNFIKKSEKAIFKQAGFEETMASAREGDVVYCDPPYVPLSVTSNFTSYTQEGFGSKEQEILANAAYSLKKRGIPVVISNHDTAFTRAMYSSANIHAFDVQRFISRDVNNRGKAAELIAVFA
jgi:DNA adenine methylase